MGLRAWKVTDKNIVLYLENIGTKAANNLVYDWQLKENSDDWIEDREKYCNAVFVIIGKATQERLRQEIRWHWTSEKIAPGVINQAQLFYSWLAALGVCLSTRPACFACSIAITSPVLSTAPVGSPIILPLVKLGICMLIFNHGYHLGCRFLIQVFR